MMTMGFGELGGLSASKLTARLVALRSTERQLLVEFLRCLGVLDERRFYLDEGFSSTFAFCTDHLGLSRSSAFRRTTAARLLASFPVIAEYLGDGRINLTNLVELRDVLSDDGLTSVLDRAAGRTEEQVKILVASLRPQPAPPDRFRRLPQTGVQPVDRFGPELSTGMPAAQLATEPRRGTIEPISAELRVLRITVGSEFARDLEAVRDALSHQIPDRRIEKVLHECLRRTLRDVQRRRTGGARPLPAKMTKPKGRHVPVAVRREVWRRDEEKCAFVSDYGRRCGSTYLIQIHHVRAFALGGAATVENLSLRCAPHNRFHAEHDGLARPEDARATG